MLIVWHISKLNGREGKDGEKDKREGEVSI